MVRFSLVATHQSNGCKFPERVTLSDYSQTI